MSPGYIPAFTLEPIKPPEHLRPVAPVSNRPRFIDDVAAGQIALPTIPSVVQRLIIALGDPDIDFRVVSAELSKDPVLSAKVLRLATSSHFGGQRAMASIESAVSLIGATALKRLVVACGVSSAIASAPGIDLDSFWREAMVTATAANKLASHCGADAEEAFLCGLLHSAGHLILCCSYPEIADAMFTGFAPVRGAELAAIEDEVFGIDHAKVGQIWVECLGFPKAVGAAIGNALQPVGTQLGALDMTLLSACSLTRAVLRDDSAELALAGLPKGLRAKFVDTEDQPNEAFSRLVEGLGQIQPMG